MLVVGPPEVEVLVGLYVVPALEYRPVAAVRVHVTVCFNCGLDRTEKDGCRWWSRAADHCSRGQLDL